MGTDESDTALFAALLAGLRKVVATAIALHLARNAPYFPLR